MNTYSNIYNLGHRALRGDAESGIPGLLTVPVLIEEKIDGSQISFGKGGAAGNDLYMRSRGAEINVDAPEGMFAKAVEEVKAITGSLIPGWIYRGEYLQKPKHNVLAYGRVPRKHIIIFDIETDEGRFLSPAQKQQEAAILGFETVPLFFAGMLHDQKLLEEFLNRESLLGGVKIEGVVIKPISYMVFGLDKKVLMGKYVSPGFRETHKTEWKKENPSSGDVVTDIISSLKTEARWNKAIQHLREAGQITDSPKDIGGLIKEVQKDVLKEEEGWIKEKLYQYALPHIKRGVIAGLPEWYKDQLLKSAFGEENQNVEPDEENQELRVGTEGS
jgi:hypothetical protein